METRDGKTLKMSKLIVPLLAAAVLAGCAAPRPSAPMPAEGFCRVVNKPRQQVCIPGPMPAANIAREAALLQGRGDRLTVYVLRNNWGDPIEPVSIEAAPFEAAPTLPGSFVRLQFRPGTTTLGLRWHDGSERLTLQGQGGEVRFLRLKGWAFLAQRSFSLQPVDRATALELIRDAKLVADLGAAD